MANLRVYIACSIDGFIAGPGGDLSWLPQPAPNSGTDYGWGAFISTIGCVLMGRGTYDAVASMQIDWPHPDKETVIATHRPLGGAPERVMGAQGSVAELVAAAKERAGNKDVYLDGGDLIRQALDAGLIDELIITLCPVVLGAGHPLFAGTLKRHQFELIRQTELPGGLVQVTYVPVR
jgi:dihydrofolate reductase